MDVELYVYDLSQGLARMYSLALTGTQMDAIYHTSLVFNNVEYYFGQGIQTSFPGGTHHGQPIEKLSLGKTELPSEVIEEYLQSLGEIYTPESYDLFLHNCNNFTQDLAMFLIGKSIPEHIRNLPQTFLNTPLGQMLKPQIEMALHGVTQAPSAPTGQPSTFRAAAPAAAGPVPKQPTLESRGKVRLVTNLSELEMHLASASKSCAVIFFTSATCPPCKIVYPTYDELAEEAGDRAVLIKVDTSTAFDVGMKFSIRATPTFITFLRGEKLDQWSGANPAQLQGNVRMLLEMAHPPHRHRKLRLPTLQRPITSYVLYKKTPPLEKLITKLHPCHEDLHLLSIVDFIKRRSNPSNPAADVPLPTDLPSFPAYLQTTFHALPLENRFALIDLTRLLFIDPRIAGYFAAEDPTHKTLLTFLSSSDLSTLPYNLRITILQLTCNLFTTPLYPDHLLSPASQSQLLPLLLHHLTNSLLDTHPPVRVVAASLAYNLSVHNHNARFTTQQSPTPDSLPEETQVELLASLSEAIAQETQSQESLHGLLLSLGLLVYEAPEDGAVIDLCRALGITETVRAKREVAALSKEPLLVEIGEELLVKGL